MKKLIKLLAVLAVLAAIGIMIKKWLDQRNAPLPLPVEDDSASRMEPAFDENELGGPVSQELLDILVCPLDKGPLKLSADGKWLVNPRNGYRYPIRRGIPVMLIEEGSKYRDESLIEAAA
jgi:uncharacterized protein YbaR (Trm112 family)